MQQLCLSPTSLGFISRPRFFSGCRCHHDSNPTPVLRISFPPLLRTSNVNRSSLAAVLLPVVAVCTVLTASPGSGEAGILSGSSGLESFQLPSLPTPDFLKKIQEASVDKYKAFDSNFKKSPYLQELLKKSRENKELHRKEIQDKYCERGAEWGIGDCSLIGLPQADKDAFFEKLRKAKSEESGG